METIFIVGYDNSIKKMISRLLASRKDVDYHDASIENFSYIMNLNNLRRGLIINLDDTIIKDEKCRQNVKRHGRIIYLRAKSSTIALNHEKENKDTIFEKETIFEIEKKLDEMKCYYEELANYIIDIDDKTIKDVFSEALAIYHYVNKVKCHIYIK